MLTSFADDEARVRRDHGRRRRLRPQAGARHRPRRRHPPGRAGRVAARPGRHGPGPRAAPPQRAPTTSWPALTEQERKILELIAEGLTNRQIGERMFLAEKTVKNYVSNLLAKLGMSRRTEAAAYAARLAERKQRSTDT